MQPVEYLFCVVALGAQKATTLILAGGILPAWCAKAVLAISNLADHRYRLALTHWGCADHVVHHPRKRRSDRG